MPVLVDRGTSGQVVLGNGHDISAADVASSRSIDVALVNNMPDSALEATERQFAELLAAASADVPVRLKLFSLPSVPRSETARRYLGENYSDIGSLWNSRPDGLIVTGTEPRAALLTDEPYWPELSRIVDWAQYATVSAVWSCLAAHVAVLRMDGISRHLMPEKRSGVFACTSLANHAVALGMPRQFFVPHSRCNDLDRDELTAAGYTILSESAKAGVDSFVKQTRSTFVFFQGHPEYDAGTLFREHRRDVARFLSGERPTYPATPQDYFARDAVKRLNAFQQRALRAPGIGLLADFPSLEQGIEHTWRNGAVQIYRNWLASIAAEKEQRTNLMGRTPTKRQNGARASYAGTNVIAIERDRPSFGVAVTAPSRNASKRSQSVVTKPAGRPKA